MSGWIKMGTGLRDHPKVVRMAGMLKSDCLRVVGALHAVWSIFDEHSPDGRLDFYSLAILDEKIGWRGFGKAMQSIGWLDADSDGLTVPEYEEHNGPTAKRRASESKRKENSRADNGDGRTKSQRIADDKRTESGQMSASDADKLRAREEEIRVIPSVADATAAEAATPLTPKDRLWALAVALLGEKGRAHVGRLVSTYGEATVLDALAAANAEQPGDPKAWIVAACESRGKAKANGHDHGTTSGLLERNPQPAWLSGTGFRDLFEAESHGCGPGNAAKFRNGERISA